MDHTKSTAHPRQESVLSSRNQPPRGPRGTQLLILLPAALSVAALLAILVWVEDFLPESELQLPPLHDSWSVLSIDGVRVGSSHQRQWQTGQRQMGQWQTGQRQTDQSGQPRIVTEATEHLRVLRQGQAVHLEVAYRCEATPSGELLACYSQQQTGTGTPLVQTGQVAGGQLHLRQLLATGPSERNIDWPAATRGYFGIEESLREQMLVPGERRTLQYLVPLLNQIAQVDLRAIEFETIEMAAGMTRLLRIDCTTRREGTTSRRTLWCDGAGEVIRSFEPTMNLTSERTTREVAQWKSPAPQYDIMSGSRVPIDPAILDPFGQAKLVYQVQLRDHPPADLFATDERQQIEPLDPRRARLTVQAAWLTREKDDLQPKAAGQSRTPADTLSRSLPAAETMAPSRFIQSDDPQVIALARRVSAGQPEASARRVALGLEKLVHDWIDKKSYQQIFASAREACQSRQGDCTEHALLLAAVCRARKIPARLAIGLVYVPEQQGFLFHLWTEGWWGGRWHGLDATLGRGGIGATHLKLHAFTLANDNLMAEITPVSQVIGQLKIRVVTADSNMSQDNAQRQPAAERRKQIAWGASPMALTLSRRR